MPPTNSSLGTEDDEEASASFRLRMPQEGEPPRCVGLAASPDLRNGGGLAGQSANAEGAAGLYREAAQRAGNPAS